jgi:hypothetical protein
MLEANPTKSKIDKADPSLANDRIDKVLPICTKLKTEVADAKRANPRTEILLPQ